MAMIFVYGTLMKGQSANDILSPSKYIARGRVDGYTLHNYGVPVAVPCSHEDAHIWGDLYKLPDDPELQNLVVARADFYESEGRLYHRQTVPVEAHASKIITVPAFIYVGMRRASPELGDATWGYCYDEYYCHIERRGYERQEKWIG